MEENGNGMPLLSVIVSESAQLRGETVTKGLNRIWWRCGYAGFSIALWLGLTVTSPGLAQITPPVTHGVTATSAEPYHLPPDKLEKAVVLGRIRPSLHFGAEFWQVGALWLLLATGAAAGLGQWVTTRTHRKWLQALIYSALLAAIVFLIVDLPAGTIGHSVSLHYKISVEEWPAWFLDQAKTLGLVVLMETPLLMLGLGLARRSPRWYWAWFAAAVAPIMALVAFLLPPLVEPLFNHFEPLAQSHPALVAELEKVVARTGTNIPRDRMFLMKASEKSNGLNAYVSGLGASKRIVVWDTTADRMPTDEILYTFAHEAGHYVLNHVAKGLTLAAVGMFALFAIVAKVSGWLVQKRGQAWQVDRVASLPGLVVLVLSLSLVQIVIESVPNIISRHFEHDADVYGQEAIHGLVPDPRKTAVASFNRLGEAYLDDPQPNPFVVFWTEDHPSTQSRAKFAAQYDPWAICEQPKFFAK